MVVLASLTFLMMNRIYFALGNLQLGTITAASSCNKVQNKGKDQVEGVCIWLIHVKVIESYGIHFKPIKSPNSYPFA